MLPCQPVTCLFEFLFLFILLHVCLHVCLIVFVSLFAYLYESYFICLLKQAICRIFILSVGQFVCLFHSSLYGCLTKTN